MDENSDSDQLKLFTRQPVHQTPQIITAIAISPDSSKFATGSYEGNILLWHYDTLNNVSLGQSTDMVVSLAFNKEGSLLLSDSECHQICVWNLLTNEPKIQMQGRREQIFRTIFLNDDYFLAIGNWLRILEIWSVKQQRLIINLKKEYNNTHSTAISGNLLASLTLQGKIQLKSFPQNRLLMQWKAHNFVGSTIDFSQKNLILSSGDQGKLKVWNIRLNAVEMIAEFQHTHTFVSAIMSSDQNYIIGIDWESSINIWGMRELQKLQTIHQQAIQHQFPLAVVADNEQYICSSGQQLSIWKRNIII